MRIFSVTFWQIFFVIERNEKCEDIKPEHDLAHQHVSNIRRPRPLAVALIIIIHLQQSSVSLSIHWWCHLATNPLVQESFVVFFFF